MKLSVIIPTFNRAQLLTEAVQSVLAHQPSVYEIIIADDASNDDTKLFCEQWQELEIPTRILVSRTENNLGAQVSRNRGMSMATGDCVLFVDSDDILAQNGLVPLLNELEQNKNLDYVYGQVIRVDSQLKPLNNIKPIGSIFSTNPREIAGYHWHTMGAIYRRKYLQKVGYWDERLTGSQDWEFQARVKMAGGKGKFIEHIVGFWRDHTEHRVGTKRFRHDYVESVIRTCIMIREQARQAGLIDASLERRLAAKILIHALEFSTHNCFQERQKSLDDAVETLEHNYLMRLLLRIWRLLPSQFDYIIFWFLKY
jgi:glycosyltransferase involved in cell wall biosynthesis